MGHQEALFNQVFHFDYIFNHSTECFSALTVACAVIKAEVASGFEADLFKLKFCGLVVKFVLEIIHHFDAFDDFAGAVLPRMYIQIMPNVTLSIKTCLKYLLLKIIP